MGIFGGTIRSLFNCCSTLAANEFAAGFTTADDPKVEVGFENIGVLEVLAGVEVGNGLDFGDVPFLVGFAKGPAGVNVSFAFCVPRDAERPQIGSCSAIATQQSVRIDKVKQINDTEGSTWMVTLN